MGVFDRSRGIYRTAPKKGVSDILCCFKGRFIAIEVKSPKDKLSPEQDGFIKNVQQAGGLACVVYNFDDFLNFWNNIVIHGC
ncbi:MAG: VRR-NUC domain-containing protein [Nanoarchaeota archaeon]